MWERDPQTPSRQSWVSIQCQVGCSCLEELLGQVGRKGFSGHPEASGNIPLWKKHQEMVNRTKVSLDSTITKVFSNPNDSLIE